MAKKASKKDKEAKKARAAAKQKKNESKAEVKNKKLSEKKKFVDEEEDDDLDIETILANFKKEQQAFEEVSIENIERPANRISPCMFANPIHGKSELLIFGGENTVLKPSQSNKSATTTVFYNDLLSFNTANHVWKKITSQNSPMPRSSAASCAHPSGIALVHGGEFSSPKQNTFYHYSDTWLLDCSTKEWTKIDQKNGPSARSGHRMTVWKNYILLHGGFRDLGTSTTYLDDLWCFDITSYKWKQIGFPSNHSVPDARSGHSFIPTQDGAILWGGYCKVKAKKNLQKGKILSDCWYLKMSSDLGNIRWERRKKQGFQPSARVGCSMAYHKGRGVLFGGVYDFEETEESLDSNFYNDLFSYQVETNRWYNCSLRPQRKAKKVAINKNKNKDDELEEILNSILKKNNINTDEEDSEAVKSELAKLNDESDAEESDADEAAEKPETTFTTKLPHSRFNAATTVVDDNLFIYGGIWECGDREFSLDSFYSIDLNKLDGVTVYWENLDEVERAEQEGVVDSDYEDEEDEDDDEDEEDEDEDDDSEIKDEKLVYENEDEEEEEVAEDEPEIPDPRPWLPHPKAFENLRAFYLRTGADFLTWAIANNRDAKGKHLKKHSFDMCQDRWWERREQVRIEEDQLEELGGVGEVIEKDASKITKRR
ncbi:hypothetical protein ACO0QE_003662 [Hanseniaspora vineae]